MQVTLRREALTKGLKHYFTGKPCKRGHVSERFAMSGVCVTCGLESFRRYYEENPEKARERTRLYAEQNPEKVKASSAASKRRRRAARGSSRHKLTEAERKQNQKARQKKYWLAHKDVCAERNRVQRQKNPEVFRSYVRARRARERNAPGSHTSDDICEIRQLQRNKCARCCISLSKVKVHVDHIMPLALGGHNDRANLQLLCSICNLQKWAKHPIADARLLGRLL